MVLDTLFKCQAGRLLTFKVTGGEVNLVKVVDGADRVMNVTQYSADLYSGEVTKGDYKFVSASGTPVVEIS